MLLINKPAGITSHDVVNAARKHTGEKRVGHTGTLDPFAEGLLIVLVGREETKLQKKFLEMDKKYLATLVLGEERDTGDVTGRVTAKKGEAKEKITTVAVQDIVKSFTGEITQVPPQYSAIKIKGKKAYEYARKGEYQELEPRRVTVYALGVVSYTWPKLILEAEVSSGTYIRALARDIGRKLGTYAYVDKLVRTRIGPYKVESALSLAQLQKIE